MQRLPDPNLVPSSMQGGNTVSDSASLSMTAPGSQSVIPVPETLDVLPLPRPSGAEIPVSNQRDRVTGNPAPGGTGPWTDITETGNGGWKQL